MLKKGINNVYRNFFVIELGMKDLLVKKVNDLEWRGK